MDSVVNIICTILIIIAIYDSQRVRRRKKCKVTTEKSELQVTFTIDNIKIKGNNMAVTLTNEQFIAGELTPQDRHGHPAKVQAGTVEYKSSDESIFTVEEDPEAETKFKIVPVEGASGVAEFSYSADADLGDGVKTIEGFSAVEVTLEGATAFGVTFGEPQDK